jgi:hypothetical protein
MRPAGIVVALVSLALVALVVGKGFGVQSAERAILVSSQPEAGMTATPQPVDLPVSGGARSTGASAGRIAIPHNFTFGSVSSVPRMDSWAGLVAGYNDEERLAIESFTGLLSDSAYSFSSAEELEWMARRGFPMPDDIVAAAALADNDLKGLALAGNTKAAFFYLQRAYLAGRSEALAGSGPEEKWRIKATAMSGESPFLGYLEALRLAAEYPESPSAAAGALGWAAMKGDTRATQELGAHNVDAAAMLSWMLLLVGEEDQLRQLGYLHGNRSLHSELRIPTVERGL